MDDSRSFRLEFIMSKLLFSMKYGGKFAHDQGLLIPPAIISNCLFSPIYYPKTNSPSSFSQSIKPKTTTSSNKGECKLTTRNDFNTPREIIDKATLPARLISGRTPDVIGLV